MSLKPTSPGSPLLDDERENGDVRAVPRSFGQRLGDTLCKPLTPLTVLLLLTCLLSSVFDGLFAGTKHNLNLEKGKHKGEDYMVTKTFAATGTTVVTSFSTTSSAEIEFSTIFIATTSTATKVSTLTEGRQLRQCLPESLPRLPPRLRLGKGWDQDAPATPTICSDHPCPFHLLTVFRGARAFVRSSDPSVEGRDTTFAFSFFVVYLSGTTPSVISVQATMCLVICYS